MHLNFFFLLSVFWVLGGVFLYQGIRKTTKQKQAVYLHHFKHMAVSNVMVFLPINLFLANVRNRILTSTVQRWIFDPMTYSSFYVLRVVTHFKATATLFSISGALILHNRPVMVTKDVPENIQNYNKGQVSVQNFHAEF